MKAPKKKERELKKEKLIAAFRAASAASGETGAAGAGVAAATAPATPEPTISSATTIMVAKAQASSPCAVSRNKTSSVRTPIHFSRRRPVKWTPGPDDN